MSIESALEYIHSVKWQGSKPGLGRTRALLEALGNPQKGLKFVHVAGTNGKGSVCACMAAVLTRAGYVTGMYTSPHLVSFNERMQVDGVRVADGELEALTDEIRPYADAMADAPTEFEIITALAMCFFARKKCDIVVLEAGMGGELDSTNVIGPPEVAVITAIGMDHTSELGETVAEIATTKAGIIKPGCVAVIYGGQREAEEIVRSRCREVGAGMVTADFGRITILSSGMDAIRFSVSPDGGIDIPPIEFPLIGEYQPRNAALAITALECLRDRGYGKITGECIGDALSRVRWPGRFEIIMREPVFILDGAHNVHGIEATARSLEALFPGRGIIFVMGVMADKDVGAMADVIAPLADEIIATRPDYPRAMDAETLARLLRRRCRARVTACPDVTGAISFAYDRAGGRGGDGVVCALGSLYFSGEVRRAVSELAEKNGNGGGGVKT
jgi:dihydrofolate synthase/folylpolyglutamate synthase